MGLVRSGREGGVLRLSLNRPDARNALSAALIRELTSVLTEAAADESVRAVVLRGEGQDLCAGADIAEMKATGAASREENLADAQTLQSLFESIHAFPRPVITRVHGNVFGGGVGLVAAADMAIAERGARFAFSEVRLGILPGVISPYVVRRIGEANARRLFLTGERFGAEAAADIGLVGEVVASDELDTAVERLLALLLAGSPDAQRRIKELLRALSGATPTEAAARTPAMIARARASADGQEGLAAFSERRRPSWAPEREEDAS
ncbi:MAG: enoyl-CoA hydratase-related protein [Gemmatimonadota bacterium]|nr:enoyl-CoA hydratase-related protein [Gemmatimonadota bacterium]